MSLQLHHASAASVPRRVNAFTADDQSESPTSMPPHPMQQRAESWNVTHTHAPQDSFSTGLHPFSAAPPAQLGLKPHSDAEAESSTSVEPRLAFAAAPPPLRHMSGPEQGLHAYPPPAHPGADARFLPDVGGAMRPLQSFGQGGRFQSFSERDILAPFPVRLLAHPELPVCTDLVDAAAVTRWRKGNVVRVRRVRIAKAVALRRRHRHRCRRAVACFQTAHFHTYARHRRLVHRRRRYRRRRRRQARRRWNGPCRLPLHPACRASRQCRHCNSRI